MNYISITEKATKEMRSLPQEQIKKIDRVILNLQNNAFPPQAKKLTGSQKSYRIRIGDYRILYTLDGNFITIFAVGHRKDVYRKI